MRVTWASEGRQPPDNFAEPDRDAIRGLTPPAAATQVAWLSRAVPVRLLRGESLPRLPSSGEPGYEEARTVRESYSLRLEMGLTSKETHKP
jgi:hypothetical protein